MITIQFNDQELEILKCAMNTQCADFISNTVDITKDDEQKACYERLYDRACLLRNKIYDEVFADA